MRRARLRRLCLTPWVEQVEQRMMLAADAEGDSLSAALGVSLTRGAVYTHQAFIGDGDYPTADVDLYAVPLAAGQHLRVAAEAATPDEGGKLSGLDTYVRVFDATGAQLASDDNSGNPFTGAAGTDASLDFIAPAAGTYFVGVTAAGNTSYDPNTAGSGSGGGTGAYRLELLLSDSAPLAAPSGLSAVAVGTDAVNLSWSAVPGATGYTVERSNDGSTNWAAVGSTGAGVSAFSDTGLSAGTTYHYRVRATDDDSVSAYSATAFAVTPLAAPAGLTAAAVSGGHIELSWEGQGQAVWYTEVEQLSTQPDGSTAWVQVAKVSGWDTTSYVSSGPFDGLTTYSFRVRMYSYATGYSPYSPVASVETPSYPGRPSLVSAAAAPDASVTVSWSPVTGAGGYRVERSGDGGSNWTTVGVTPAGVTSYTDPAQSNSPDAVTQGSWRGVYGSDGFVVPGDPSGNDPTYPSYVTPTFSGQNVFTWDPSPSDPRAPQQASGPGRVASAWYTSSAIGGSFSIDVRPTDGRSHRVSVYALDWDNNGRTERVDLLDDATGAVLDSRPLSNFQGGEYLSWWVSGAVTIRVTNSGPTNAVLSGLFFDGGHTAPVEASTYQYRVVATGAAGDSAPSTPVGVNTPPLAPTGLTAGLVSGGRIDLTWSDQSLRADSYDVEQSTDGVNWVQDGVVSGPGATSFTATGPFDGLTTYYFRVRAHDPGGVYSIPAMTSVETPSYPGRPSLVSATAASDASVTVSWSPAAGAGGYRVERSGNGGSTWSEVGRTPAGVTSFTDSALHGSPDAVTQGDWVGAYGSDGFVVPGDPSGNDPTYPSYVTPTFSGENAFTWDPSPSDPRAPQQSSGSGRIASGWYSFSSFSIDLKPNDTAFHRVSVYALDYDNQSRTEQIDLISDATGLPLDTRSLSSFQNGVYLSWWVSGAVTIKVTNTGQNNAVLSGLFFDGGPAAPAKAMPYQYRVVATGAAGDSAHSTPLGVNTPSVIAADGASLEEVEGVAFTQQVASFAAARPGTTTRDFTATVDWGDGSTSVGDVVSTGPGSYAVAASHTYAEDGTYPVEVAVTGRGAPPVAAQGSAWVDDAPLDAETTTATLTSGSTFGGALATFTEGRDDAAADFTATIEWTDEGGTLPATVVTPTTPVDPFQVVAPRAFARAGSYNYQVTVTDDDGQQKSVSGWVTVTDPPDVVGATIAAVGLTVTAVAGQPYAGPIALSSGFTSSYGGGLESETVNWGDGTAPSDGPHTYQRPGSYTATASFDDGRGARSVATSTVNVVATDTGAGIHFIGPSYIDSVNDGVAVGGGVFYSPQTVDVSWFNAEYNSEYGPYKLTYGPAPEWAQGGPGSILKLDYCYTSDEVTITNPVSGVDFEYQFVLEIAQTGYAALFQYCLNAPPQAGLDGWVGNVGISSYYPTFQSFPGPFELNGEGIGPVVHDLSVNDIAAVEGVPTGTIALGTMAVDATDVSPVDSVTSYPSINAKATVDWGDGSSGDAILARNGSGEVTIYGNHIYDLPGTYTLTIRVNATNSQAPVVAQGRATVGEGSVSAAERAEGSGQADLIPVGEADVAPNTGGVRVSVPLDFDQSPGTTVGGDPALVYSSDTLGTRPVIEATLATDPSQTAPTSVQVQLTWDSSPPQPWQTFNTVGYAPGEPIHLDLRLAATVAKTGVFPWVLHIREITGGTPVDAEISGKARVVVRDATGTDTDPYGPGWGLAGVPRLYPQTDNGPNSLGSILWVDGSGDSELFAVDFTNGGWVSPPGDFGTLSRDDSGSGYLYAAKGRTWWHFDQNGLLTSVVDPDGVTRSYHYDSSGRLDEFDSPDNGVTFLNYVGAELATIDEPSGGAEPGGRVVTLSYGTAGDLTGVTDATGATRTFGYDSDHHLVSDHWAPLQTTFTYDPDTGTLASVDRGEGDVTLLTSAVAGGLAGTPGVAVVEDALGRVTTYTLDPEGRELRLDGPMGISEVWGRDDQGQVTSYTDPRGYSTTYTYQGDGDLVEVDHPDGGVERFRYDPTYHEVTQALDADGGLSTWTYQYGGDPQSYTDPAGNVTWFDYDPTGLLQSVTEGTLTTNYTYDADRRLKTVTVPDGGQTAYTYDDNGNPRTVTDPDGFVTTTVYDGRNLLVERIDPPPAAGDLPLVTTMDYGAAGLLSSETDPRGIVTRWDYDQRGLQTAQTVAYGTADAETTTTVYDPAGEVISTIDARSEETDYGYDDAGRRVTVTDPERLTTTFSYDLAGDVLSVIDPRLYETDYTYDPVGRETSETLAAGTTDAETSRTVYDHAGDALKKFDFRNVETDYSYDPDGRLRTTTVGEGTPAAETSREVYNDAGDLVAEFDPLGRETVYTYDGEHRETSKTEAAGTPLARTTETFYDPDGRVVATVDALDTETDYAYDAEGRQVLVTEAVGTPVERTTQTSYDADGNVHSTVDARGFETLYTYDDEGRELSVTEAANTDAPRTTSFGYDADGDLTWTLDALDTLTTFAYDPDGRQIAKTEAVGTPQQRVTQTFYDADGNVRATVDARNIETDYRYDGEDRQTSVTEAAGTFQARTSHTRYDADGNVTATVDAHGVETDYTYDAEGRQVTETLAANTSLARTTTTVYDADGEVTATIDPLNHETDYGYDALGRQVTVTDPDHHTTTTAYDLNDDVVSVTDPDGNTTQYSYDALGRRTGMTDPLGHQATYSYDAGDDLVSTTDRDGRRTDTTYDAFGRDVTERWYDASGTLTDTVVRTYDANDDLLTATNNHGATAVAFTYDALGRAATRTGPFGDHLTYSYDANDNRTSVADSFGGVTNTAYDDFNRAVTVSAIGVGQTPLRTDFTYTPTDQLASVTRSSDASGGRVVGSTQYLYDPAERLTTVVHDGPAGTPLATFVSAYDASDHLASETDDGVTRTYSYDDAGQLTADGATAHAYDAAGNRTDTGDQPAAGNRLLSDGTWAYSYDAEGNRVKKVEQQTGETWTYSYDNENRLVRADDRTAGGILLQAVAYAYDALGDRVEEDVTPAGGPAAVTRFAYDGTGVWADLNADNTLRTRYLRDATDAVLAQVGSDGLAAWLLTDRLGSARAVTDAAGAVVDRVDYDAFGRTTSESDPAAGPAYGYAGMRLDPATGVYHVGVRDYDARAGVWTTQDPMGFGAGDTNLTRYVANQPTDATDPSGLDAVGVEGSNVVWRVPANDNRSGLRKFWDGLTGQNQSPERSYVVGRLSSLDGYQDSVILGNEFGGRKVSLADLQQAARVVNLGGVAPEQQAGAIAYQIQKTAFGLYGSETQTQDRIVGALASGIQFAADFANMVSPLPTILIDGVANAGGMPSAAQADEMLGGFIGNPNGSAYHQGKMEGEAGIMLATSVGLAFPGGLSVRSANSAFAEGIAPNSQLASVERSGLGVSQQALPRTPGIPDSATMAEILENGWIPGRQGITVTDRTVMFSDMFKASKASGVEFGLARETIGESRVFKLYSGGGNNVRIPSGPGARNIGHTHPQGSRYPSTGPFSDMDNINKAFLKALQQDPATPLPHRRVIWGEGLNDNTVYYPDVLR
jgi:RHS repeat-associated protein